MLENMGRVNLVAAGVRKTGKITDVADKVDAVPLLGIENVPAAFRFLSTEMKAKRIGEI